MPTIDKSFQGFYDEVLHEGFLGVSFFFVLSGFILALNYKEKILQKEVSMKEFWVARVSRIYPLHLFTLLYSLPIFFSDIFHAPFRYLKSLLANLFLVQSFVPSPEVYFGFNAVSWSISNELFYYLMFPLLLVLFYRYPKSIAITVGLFMLIPVTIYFTPRDIQVFIFSINPLVRIADFILGILLFKIFEFKLFSEWFRKSTSATIAEVSAVLLFILFFSFHNEVPVGYRFAVYYWIPMLCIIYVFAHSAGLLSKFLSYRVLVFLGEISFSFYMFHALTMRYIKAAERRLDYTPDVYYFVVFIFLVTLGISILSYYYLELPSNRRIRNWYRERKKETLEPQVVNPGNEPAVKN